MLTNPFIYSKLKRVILSVDPNAIMEASYVCETSGLEWLIKSNAFRKVLNDLIADKKMENVKTEENIIGTIRFLEKLLEITTEDILSARVERSH
ncbi:hypothetical protein J2Y02_001052 [Neobacillus drentensis]|nr:hypothetical protein [Neobacillus drentensis]